MFAQATVPTIDQTLRAIDHASAMSDRWLFLAALLVLLFFAGLVIKWLVKQNEQQRTESLATTKELIIALHNATEVMNDVRALLEETGVKPNRHS